MPDAPLPTIDELALLLSFISADDRETWITVGMGVKAAYHQDGFTVWDNWSRGGDKYDPKAAITVWKSFRKRGTGFGTVVKLAQDNGWKPEKRELSPEDKRRFAAEAEARRKQRQAEVEADEARAAVMREAVSAACQRIWDSHVDPTGTSQYLERKQAGAHGVGFFRHAVLLVVDDQKQRADVWIGSEATNWLRDVPSPRPEHLSYQFYKRGHLAVPLRDGEGRLWSFQTIAPNGTKLFPRYSRKSGCLHLLGAEHETPTVVTLAEGYATAASCHEATGWPVAVGIDSGNLPAVADVLRHRFPGARIVLAGDDDETVTGNPGRTKAEAAALAVGGTAVFPGGEPGQDWNDIRCALGLEEVRRRLLAALAVAPVVHTVNSEQPLPGAPSASVEPEVSVLPEESLPLTPSLERPAIVEEQESDTHPPGGGGFRISEQELLKDFVVIYGSDLAWDCARTRMVKLKALREAVGATTYKWWQQSENRRMAQDVVFDPTELCAATVLNLYDGFHMARGSESAEGCKRIRAHLQLLCGNRADEYNFLLRWIAYPLQNPGAKMATAVVMFGSEGPGKSLLWEKVVKRIYGQYGTTVGQAQLEDKYTGWQSRKLFALAEEVVSREEMRHYKGVLKHLVTGDTLQIDEKYQAVREERNHLNFVFLSNSTVPLALDDGDRRYFVLYIDKVPPPGYFSALVEEINGGGVENFYDYLMSLDLTGFGPHTKPPVNEEKQGLIDGSLPAPRYFVRRWMAGETDFPVTGAVTQHDLWQAFTRWCEGSNEFKRRQRDFSQEVIRDLKQERPDISYPMKGDDAKTTRIYATKEFWDKKKELGRGWASQAAEECRRFARHFDRRSLPPPDAFE